MKYLIVPLGLITTVDNSRSIQDFLQLGAWRTLALWNMRPLLRLFKELNIGKISPGAFRGTMARYIGLPSNVTEEAFDHAWNKMVVIEPAVLQQFKTLAQTSSDIKIVCFSNTNPIHWEYIKENFPQAINRPTLSFEAKISDIALLHSVIQAIRDQDDSAEIGLLMGMPRYTSIDFIMDIFSRALLLEARQRKTLYEQFAEQNDITPILWNKKAQSLEDALGRNDFYQNDADPESIDKRFGYTPQFSSPSQETPDAPSNEAPKKRRSCTIL